MRVWIDIENAPQVRYLLPCKALFEQAGAEVVVTARDDGATFRLLESESVQFHQIGRQPGGSKRQKVGGLLKRAHALSAFAVRSGRPDMVLSASRPASLAARRLGLPAFYIGDYEYSNVTVQRLTHTYLLFPDVIDAEIFRDKGMRADRLIPFRGIKEDISFAGIAIDAIAPHRFAGADGSASLLLFRPPAEESHYHRRESTSLAAELLAVLARESSVQVILSPRYERQTGLLEQHSWHVPPLVLREPVHFVSLLKGVDLVVSSGGTMLREAAYLGVPAYSIFQGRIGAVDRYLESIGRLRMVSSQQDFASIVLRRGLRQPVIAGNPNLPDELLAEIVSRLPSAHAASRAHS